MGKTTLFTPIETDSYHWIRELSTNQSLMATIQFKENPMYIDEDGIRHLQEPMYMTVIQVQDNTHHLPLSLMYDYFDAESEEEAKRYIRKIGRQLSAVGVSKVVYS